MYIVKISIQFITSSFVLIHNTDLSLGSRVIDGIPGPF